MRARLQRTTTRTGAVFTVFAAIVLITPSGAQARPNIRDAFFAVYPGAVGTVLDTVPSHTTHCGVCHYDFNGGGARNPYGVRLGQALPGFPTTASGRQSAVRSIEQLDSDTDGYTTLVEITDLSYANTPTFPGLTPALVGSVSGVSVADIQDHLVPMSGADVTPPQVAVLAPAGGSVLTGNLSAVVQWTASDASGIAAIHIYLSIDGGLDFRPVALNVPQTGSYTWFPPNRPTTTAVVRVVAIDNASNEGHDDSDSFTIVSPPGGLAPTTLRDFDQPGSQPLGGLGLNDPVTCAACHGGYNPAVEPYFNWRGSMMAQASRDLLSIACMTIGNQDAPDSGDLCLRCHIPAGWLGGRSVPTGGGAMLAADKHGVSCDLCHRLVDIFYWAETPIEDLDILALLDLPPNDFANGMYVVDPTGARRGPFVDAASGHAILVSPFHREAALCGTCHDVSNPALQKDALGNYVPNAFDQPATDFSSDTLMPIERTYSEWLHSAYNTPEGVYAPQFGGNRDYVSTCQHCHLHAVTGQGCSSPSAPLREDLPLHDMTGGSTWYPGLLNMLYPGQVDDLALQAGIGRARYMLQNAAEMSLSTAGGVLQITVTNNSGHKLPTGYPEGRRIWLNVQFYDAGGALVGESGAYDPDTGVLTHDTELTLYEAKPGVDEVIAPLLGVEPGPSFHFVLNNKFFKDTRIPPRGFTSAAFAEFGGAPVGASYADGQYWSDSTYPIPPAARTAEVRLYYQSTSKEFIEFLRDENHTNDVGQQLYDLWAANGKCPPELMLLQTIELPAALVPGDLNCDGLINTFDIDPFVLALTDPTAYEAAYANCDRMNADCNADGVVNAFDIDPFVMILTGG
jgi:hypothetical protein